MKSRRVLHIFPSGGTAAFLRGQAAFWRSEKFTLHVCAGDDPHFRDILKREELSGEILPTLSRNIDPWGDLQALAALREQIDRFRPDILHGNTPKGGLLAALAGASTGLPSVYHMRGFPAETASGWKRWLLLAAERLSCALATRIVAVSRSLADLAAAAGVCARDRLEVIGHGSSNGVDAETRFNPARWAPWRSPLRRQLAIPPHALAVAYVGRLAADKGVRELAAAWRLLRESVPEAMLVIVGGCDARDPAGGDALRSFRGDPRVRLTGNRSDIPALLASIDLLTLPTYREGFPNVLLEAAAMGLPVVSTAVTGCVDAVQQGRTGLLVPARDAEALAAGLLRYGRDPDLRQRHGRAARARVRRHFRPETIWRGLRDIYVDLAAPTRLPNAA